MIKITFNNFRMKHSFAVGAVGAWPFLWCHRPVTKANAGKAANAATSANPAEDDI